MLDWERDDLVRNMGDLPAQSERDVQERIIWHLLLVHDDYGTGSERRLASRRPTCGSSSRFPARSSPPRIRRG